MITLFDRHYAILKFLREFRNENGYSASFREICDAVNINSLSLVRFYLNGLEEAGMLTRTPGISRSVVLTEKGISESTKELRRGQVIKISLFDGEP